MIGKTRHNQIRRGYFGEFGGRFAPETLMPVLDEVEKAYAALKKDKNSGRNMMNYCTPIAEGPHRYISPGA